MSATRCVFAYPCVWVCVTSVDSPPLLYCVEQLWGCHGDCTSQAVGSVAFFWDTDGLQIKERTWINERRKITNAAASARSRGNRKMMWIICCVLRHRQISTQLNPYGGFWTDVLYSALQHQEEISFWETGVHPSWRICAKVHWSCSDSGPETSQRHFPVLFFSFTWSRLCRLRSHTTTLFLFSFFYRITAFLADECFPLLHRCSFKVQFLMLTYQESFWCVILFHRRKSEQMYPCRRSF